MADVTQHLPFLKIPLKTLLFSLSTYQFDTVLTLKQQWCQILKMTRFLTPFSTLLKGLNNPEKRQNAKKLKLLQYMNNR